MPAASSAAAAGHPGDALASSPHSGARNGLPARTYPHKSDLPARFRQLRITFVLPTAVLNGGTRVLAIHAAELQRRGHRVTVVSLPADKQSFKRKLRSFAGSLKWPSDPKLEPSFFDQTNVPHHIIESVRPVTEQDVPDADVIMATFWLTAPWVAAMPSRKGTKAFFVQGYETAGEYDATIDAAWQLPLHKIFVSKWLERMARERFGDAQTHCAPNSVDTGQFFASERGKQPSPTVGLLYAARPLKGVDIALSALERVRKELPDLRVLLFGSEQISASLVPPPGTEFHYRPPQNELRNIYARSDAWLCGARQDGFHLPLLEAMACRCPVVTSRIGGATEFVEHGVNGFLVDVNDAVGLAERTIQLLTLPEDDWRTMSKNALDTARRYTWKDATDLFENALYEITGSGKVPRP